MGPRKTFLLLLLAAKDINKHDSKRSEHLVTGSLGQHELQHLHITSLARPELLGLAALVPNLLNLPRVLHHVRLEVAQQCLSPLLQVLPHLIRQGLWRVAHARVLRGRR